VDGTLLVSDSPEAEATRVLPQSRATGEAPTEVLRDTGKGKLTTSALKPGSPSAAIGAPRRSISRRRLALIVALIVLIVVVPIAILGIAGYISYRHARATEVAIDSIAVLPFENQSHDPDSEYLSDGVTESIINSLTQLPNLKVIARSSVFRYKGKETDPFAVGKELGVRAILTGRIMQRGDSLTISTELVDVRDNKQLWGEKYERKASDLMSLQRDIAGQITSTLRLTISGEAHNRMMKHYTDNPEAYQLYLKGRFYWNKRTGEALKKSIEYFNQAIEKDPSYALAYAGLADAYSLLANYAAASPQESFPKAKAAARRALELDDALAEAHTSLGSVLSVYDWNVPEATKEFQRAIELNPNYATAHQWYSDGPLLTTGRFDEAIAEMKRAQELDPLSLIINADLGLNYIEARQYDKAIEQLRKAIEMDQSFYFAHWSLGIAYEMKGSFPQALAEYQTARRLVDDPSVLGLVGHAYALSGKRDEALKTLNQMKEISQHRYVPAYSFAMVYAGLGEKDQAFQWLEKSYQNRAPELVNIKVDPLFDNLHTDPRFADLVRRVGLPQ
jgi:TolB-like protein